MTQTQYERDADAFADLVEHMDMMLAMRENADTCTTYSGRTQEIGALVADSRSLMRRVRAHLRSTSPAGEVGEMIERMTQRFLQWKLPENFNPDAGISFNPEFNAEWNAKQGLPPQRHEPTGTNLFDYTQAKAMVEHLIEGERLAASDTEAMRLLRELRGYVVAVVEAENKKFNRDHLARIDAALAKGGAA